jgi:hypothetical protein
MSQRKRKISGKNKSIPSTVEAAPADKAEAVSFFNKLKNQFIPLLIASIFVVVPILMLFKHAGSLETYSWQKTPAKILTCNVTANNLRPTLEILYSYEYQGVQYTNNAYRLDAKEFRNFADAYESSLSFPASKQTYCLVNPSTPAQAALRPSRLTFGGNSVILLCFSLAGCMVIWVLLHPELSPPPWIEKAFALLFFAIPTFFLVIFTVPIVKSLQARNWEPVPCSVLGSYQVRSGKKTSARVTYTYQWQGKKWFSNQYKFDILTRNHISGPSDICYVNPSKPYESVIQRNLDASVWAILFPLAFCAFLAKAFWRTWWPKRRKSASR